MFYVGRFHLSRRRAVWARSYKTIDEARRVYEQLRCSATVSKVLVEFVDGEPRLIEAEGPHSAWETKSVLDD